MSASLRNLFVLCLLLAVAGPAAGQELLRLPPVDAAPPGSSLPLPQMGGRVTLRELTEFASRQHPDVLGALADIESAKGDRVQSALYPNPRFETNNPEFWAGRTSQVNFGFQQDVITKGKIRLEKAAADQQVRKNEARYVLQRMAVITDVRAQYYRTLAAREQVHVNEQFVRLSEQSLHTAEKLVQAGQGSTTDVLLIVTELERARVNLENSRATLNAELAQLASVSGMPDLEIADLEGSIFDPLPKYDPMEIRNFLITRSNYMEIASAEIARNKMRLRREEVEPYPNLRLGPAYAIQTDNNRGQFWLSVVFDIPVWDLNQGNIRQARAELQGAVADMNAKRIELLRKLSDVSNRHAVARNGAERIQTVILPNAQRAQQLVGEGFEKGVFDVNRVLQARRSLLDVNNDLIDALERAWSTAADLSGMLQIELFP